MKATKNVRNGRKAKNQSLKKREDRAIQEILQIEALETRMLLSGIGTGLNKKKVVFTDATGDTVTVSLTGKATTAQFDITLDGGAANKADIQSIDLHGLDGKTLATSNEVLSIVVTPVRATKGSAVAGVIPNIWSDGITHVGLIDVGLAAGNTTGKLGTNTTMAGIASSGAALENISLAGVDIGSVSANLGQSAQIDRIMTTVSGNISTTYVPQAQFVDFGAISAHSIGTLSLIGNAAAASSTAVGSLSGNDFLGTITVAGTLGSIRGVNATLGTANHTASITAGSLNNINILGLGAGSGITTTSATGTLVVSLGTTGVQAGASINAGGNLQLGIGGAGTGGSITAGGTISGIGSATTPLVFVGGLGGVVHAGGNIADITALNSNNNANSGVNAVITSDHGNIGNISAPDVQPGNTGIGGTIHALTGNIGSLTTSGVINGNFIADHGNIAQGGSISGDTINGAFISAPDAAAGQIGDIVAHTATQGTAINGVRVHGQHINSITATNDVLNGVGIAGSSFRADSLTSIGPVKVSVSGGPGAIGINNSQFSTAGSFGTITVSAGSAGGIAGVGDAIRGNGNATGIGGNQTVFSAGHGYGNITINGNIAGTVNAGRQGVLFLAGYDVGANQQVDGPGVPTDDVLGSTTAVDQVFGTTFTVNGNVFGTAIVTGVNPVNAVFGDTPGFVSNDIINNPNGTTANLHVSGYTTTSTIEAATLGSINQNQVFINNTVIYFGTGTASDIVIDVSNPGGAAFQNNTILAPNGSLGNILVHNSSLAGTDAISGTGANGIGAKGSIGDIVGITDGTGSGINTLNVGLTTATTPTSIGSVIGVATNSNGGNGIVNTGATIKANGSIGTTISAATTAFIAGKATLPVSATPGIAGLTAGGDTAGVGGLVGGTYTADADNNATGSIGAVTGISSNATANAGAYYGINGITVNAGQNIGAITGTVAARAASVGINNSAFNANGGAASTAGGVGQIGNIVASSTNALATGNHTAILGTGFTAGNNVAGGTGTIGTVNATASATGATGAVTASGIDSSTFVAGIGAGVDSIGAFTVGATAASSGGNATALGITGTNGTTAITIGNPGVLGGTSTINAITVSASATTNTGTALAIGVGNNGNSVTLTAGNGDQGNGHIFAITAGTIAAPITATTLNGAANAYAVGSPNGGGTTFTAGNSGTGTGTVDGISGVATANASNGAANAYGVNAVGINAGAGAAGSGTVGNLTGIATANSTSTGTLVNATAIGLRNLAVSVITNTTSTVANSSIANLVGTATATATTAGTSANTQANAAGIYNTAGGFLASSIGTIDGTATTVAKSTSVSPGTANNSTARGIDVTGLGGGNAFSTGAAKIGTIGGGIAGHINGTAAVDAEGSSSTGTVAEGILGNAGQAFTAGTSTTGTIAPITGTVTNAIALATTGNAQVTANGLDNVNVTAATTGVGTVGAIQGLVAAADATQHLTATSTSSTSINAATINGAGIANLVVNAGTGLGGAGSIGAVTGTVGFNAASVVATATLGNAVVTVKGIDPTTLNAGQATSVVVGGSSVGAINGTVFGTATGAGAGFTNSATGFGIQSLSVTVDGKDATVGEQIGAVTGSATVVATETDSTTFSAASASAVGIDGHLALTAGTATTSKGIIGDVKGVASAVATANGTKVTNTAYAQGLGLGDGSATINILAGRNGNGQVGKITGDVTTLNATANNAIDTTAGVTTDLAQVYGEGILSVVVDAADLGTNVGIGSVGAISGSVDASAASAAKGQAYSQVYGIDSLTVTAGATAGNDVSTGSVGAINGTIGSASAAVTTTGLNINAGTQSYGITGLTVNAAAGGLTGTVGAITGNVWQTATATGTGKSTTGAAYTPTATVSGYGVDGLSLNVGGGSKVGSASTGSVTSVTGKATLIAIANGTLDATGSKANTATTTGYGIGSGLTFNIGTGTNATGTIGAIDGEIATTSTADTGVGNTGTANNTGGATGIGTLTVNVGNGTGTGTVTGNITGIATSALTGTTKTATDLGINTLTVVAPVKGSIQNIISTGGDLALNVSAGSVGAITESNGQITGAVTATDTTASGTGVGAISAALDATLGVGNAAISGLTVTSAKGITSVSGTNSAVTGTSNGIDSSKFIAQAGTIGAITGTAQSVAVAAAGINNSLFSAVGGSIASITANTKAPILTDAAVKTAGVGGPLLADGGWAIAGSTFAADGNIGAVTVATGGIINSNILAGYNLGANLKYDGKVGAAGDDSVSAVAAQVGAVSVAAGWFVGSNILVNPNFGADNIADGVNWAGDDAGSLAGSKITSISIKHPAGYAAAALFDNAALPANVFGEIRAAAIGTAGTAITLDATGFSQAAISGAHFEYLDNDNDGAVVASGAEVLIRQL